MTLVCLGFRRAGILKNSITMEHYHDLGKWLFALTAFYTYMAFSQYLLIWYANIPEETIWYRHRIGGKLAGRQPGDAVHPLYHSVFHAAVPAGEAEPDDDRGVWRCGVWWSNTSICTGS